MRRTSAGHRFVKGGGGIGESRRRRRLSTVRRRRCSRTMKVERERKGHPGLSTTWLTSPRRQPCVIRPSGSRAGSSCRAFPSGSLGLHHQHTLDQVT
ncbi:hypothetical protein D8674_013864 [Pyrus ussuriensis x Pyrus communis]|uniref:Uncharacterized protein n=1 Tax=Pyrus ussuriensis x Pyrus communis TaxID=2448454 RepID=A0A5N5GQX1_9ROSA|nr:hypothetical protein D8674_013864 [Pyrus ussuriensis x Pyrus communis]